MKSLKTVQTLSGLGRVLSKLAFVFSVIGFCGCVTSLFLLGVGGDSLFRIGGMTLHGLLPEAFTGGLRSAAAALCGWAVVCAGEAVLARFAELYFKNERQAGTPFTLAGARELLRLGILTLAIPTGCALLASILSAVTAGILDVGATAATELHFGNGANVALGVMFIVTSLLCRCGAELGDAQAETFNDRPKNDFE